MKIKISKAERDAILAGLRLLQQHLSLCLPGDVSGVPSGIVEVFTNDFSSDGLSEDEIDTLCERINN